MTIPDNELRVDMYDPRPAGERGGQQAGSPHMGVKVTHIPTGVFAMSILERNQHKNKVMATDAVELMLCGL